MIWGIGKGLGLGKGQGFDVIIINQSAWAVKVISRVCSLVSNLVNANEF